MLTLTDSLTDRRTSLLERLVTLKRRACRVNKLAKLWRCVSLVSFGPNKFGPSKLLNYTNLQKWHRGFMAVQQKWHRSARLYSDQQGHIWRVEVVTNWKVLEMLMRLKTKRRWACKNRKFWIWVLQVTTFYLALKYYVVYVWPHIFHLVACIGYFF